MNERNSHPGQLSKDLLIEYLERNMAAAEAALQNATGVHKAHYAAQLLALREILNKIRAGDFDQGRGELIH